MSNELYTGLGNAELLDFWKNMALGLKDEMVSRGNYIEELEGRLREKPLSGVSAELRNILLEMAEYYRCNALRETSLPHVITDKYAKVRTFIDSLIQVRP